MRVAVTGAGGRLGTSLVKQLTDASAVSEVLAWDLPVHNLDDPVSARRLVTLHRPDVVIHAAAWTDVDGCARDPELAMRRNGTAVGEMAQACADAGAAIVVVSTNEVFDGRRIDGLPYGPTDRPNPGNPYGAAKLAGETAARAAYGATGDGFAAAATAGVVLVGDAPAILPMPAVPALAIVRTAWLCGLPGLDFPQKIVAAAEKARGAGQTLSLVSDEVGCPTYAPDLAGAIVALIVDWGRPGGRNLGGIHHIINTGRASRAEWAREILRLAGIDIVTNEVPLSTWPRPSNPPAWGALEPTPLPGGLLRSWQEAAAEYMELLARKMEAGR